MLIEAAWSAASVPGPPRAFFLRIKDRKGLNVAVVATTRKIAGLTWQLLTKEAAFLAMKMRKLELRAGAPRAHGPAGPGRDYWIKEIPAIEKWSSSHKPRQPMQAWSKRRGSIRAHETLAFWLRRESARRQCQTTKWWKDVIFRELVGTAKYAR